MYSRVLGTGSALPKRIVTNGEFAAMLARDGIETSDEWIRTRTGIESRHFADEAEANAKDPVLNLIEQENRRPTLIAKREERDGKIVYRFDIRLQGENETVFLDV